MKRLVLFLDGERETTIKLLGVDHDRDVVEMLTGWLQTRGYEVRRASSGKQALGAWQEHQADLIMLDTLVQDVAALALCRKMRSDHDVLVIVVTEENDVHDEVGCLECGADDSRRQPFFPAQLVARMRAVSPRGRSTLAQPPSSLITIGPIPVDALHQEVRVSGKTVRLTPGESNRLHVLAVKTNAVCTSEHLVSRVWGGHTAGESRLITAPVRHLRRKVERDPGNPPLPPPRCRRGLHVGRSANGYAGVPREGEIGGRRWMPSSEGTKYAWRRPGSSCATRRA